MPILWFNAQIKEFVMVRLANVNVSLIMMVLLVKELFAPMTAAWLVCASHKSN
jgi:hypothetical protein